MPSVALRNHAKPLWQCDGQGLACVESESKCRWVSSVQWRGKGQACWAPWSRAFMTNSRGYIREF